MFDNEYFEIGDAVQRVEQFELLRQAIDEIDERLLGEITREVWRAASSHSWKCGYETDPLTRWWFAPLEWRRTPESSNCQYDFEIYFYLTFSGDPCSGEYPSTTSLLGHMAGVNGSSLVVRCHVYRLLTKDWVGLLSNRLDIIDPLIAAGWIFGPSTGYLEYPLSFKSSLLSDEISACSITESLAPIRLAIDQIRATQTILFEPIFEAAMQILASRKTLKQLGAVT